VTTSLARYGTEGELINGTRRFLFPFFCLICLQLHVKLRYSTVIPQFDTNIFSDKKVSGHFPLHRLELRIDCGSSTEVFASAD
jgi:hypothetical protein